MILSYFCLICVFFITIYSFIITYEMKNNMIIFPSDFSFLFITSFAILGFSYIMKFPFITISCISNILWGIFLVVKYYLKRKRGY